MKLEEELPRLLDELAEHHAVSSPPVLETRSVQATPVAPDRTRSRTVIGVAAALALLVGGLVAIAALRDDDASTSTPMSEPSTPAPDSSTPSTNLPPGSVDGVLVLAPQPDSGVAVTASQRWDRSSTAAGALVAPDGTVFSIVVGAGGSWLPDLPDWETIPAERRDTRTVAGYEVAAVVDDSSRTQIYRAIRDECWSIEVVTAGEAMWSDDLDTLLSAIQVAAAEASDLAPVSVDTPTGWTSLGGGRMDESWTMDLDVEVDGQMHDVNLTQIPNGPIGFLLSGESNPQPFEHVGWQWWSVDIVTTPGITSVIGFTDLGAFQITSNLPADALVSIVDSMTPTPVEQLGANSDSMTEATPTIDTVAPPAADCRDLGTGLEFPTP